MVCGQFITGLTEGFDALKSEREGKLTLRTFKAENKPAPVLLPQEVLQMREQLRLSRPVFAHYLRTNARTLENWEQGRASALVRRIIIKSTSFCSSTHKVFSAQMFYQPGSWK